MTEFTLQQVIGRKGCKVSFGLLLDICRSLHFLIVLSAEDHHVASEMGHHYTTDNYGDDDHIHIPPGEEGFEFSHGGGEYADFEDIREGFKTLKT